MHLLIAIPALDEEDSIGSIIERCLNAREQIIAESPVTEITISAVSDGSTDRTVEIAERYADRINVIVFEKNRGYGAAITEAWRQSNADLLSFLDADGTCDPKFFAPLCRTIVEKDADVVLGCRMTAQSRMPLVRRVGNRLFALMLSAFSFSRVRDAASGMRVARRTSLEKLYPLPTGLHFTPAMSARALLSRNVKICEIDMPYEERSGESKLNPLWDGIRFLRVIVQTALLYRPTRPLGIIALLLLLLTLLMMVTPAWNPQEGVSGASPVVYWVQNRQLEEWMIYRFLVGELLSSIAILIACASYIGRKAVDIALSDDPKRDKYHGPVGWYFATKWFWIGPVLLTAIGVALVGEALIGFLKTGQVTEHWSRFVAMMGCLSLASILVVTRVVDFTLNLLADQLAYVRNGDVYAQYDTR